MAFSWRALADFIARLSVLALQWYREIASNTDERDEYRARKAASRVLDPDTPERDVREVHLD